MTPTRRSLARYEPRAGGPRFRAVPEALWRAHPNVIPREMIESELLLVAFGFKCNLACTFCIVEDMLDRNTGVSLEAFRDFAAHPDAMRGVKCVVLSGGEATLERELVDYAAVARGAGVEHVRIQTNATRLKSRDYLRTLIDAGIDEFFVSVHAHDEATCARITRRANAFKDIAAGLENVARSGARLITNTVMVKQNYRHLDDIARMLAPLAPSRMEFWNLWPRTDHGDERDHIVPFEALTPELFRALETCRAGALPAAVKWYPRCLLGPWTHLLDNSQPTALIDAEHWDKTPAHACHYADRCRHAGEQLACMGLSRPYIQKYGWEEALLAPEARPEAGAPEARPDAGAVPDEWLSGLDLAVGASVGGAVLERAERRDGAVRLLWREPAAGQMSVDLLERAEGRACYARSASFDVRHARTTPAQEPAMRALLGGLMERLRRRDRGGLSLAG